MDAGRRWALETFGEYGPHIREQVAQHIRSEHEASLDAQEASGHRSKRVYGEFWSGVLERFETFGKLPDAALVRPGRAPYKIPVIKGVALFPWRFSNNKDTGLGEIPFGTSEARIAMTELPTPATQGALDLNLPDAGLSESDRAMLEEFQLIADDSSVPSGRLVVVAVSSSSRGLFSVEWGEVQLRADRCVQWMDFTESLLPVQQTKPVSITPTRTFTSGALPPKFPRNPVERSGESHDG
ncbi:hypothetical protein ACIGKR_29285 [Rhodococcus qingshengii]|uniref:hypothetical protein n=1 Tax=Rhodococcus qingshengii TaxID=334542 RepID=UPI0037C8CE7A